MTRQAWTALVAAVAFTISASLLVVLPVPYVTWSPGLVADALGTHRGQPLIRIEGIATYPTTGRLDLTTVSQTPAGGRLSLPQAIFAYLAADREAIPREAVYGQGETAEQVGAEETELMQTSQHDAVVAALRAAHQPVSELPVVAGVRAAGPADHRLEPGDLIAAVDSHATPHVADVTQAIRRQPPGATLLFDVIRSRQPVQVSVVSEPSATEPDLPVVGLTVATGYRYGPDISFDLGDQIGGPSAGLVFSLAIYDKITPGALLAGRHVAGTGTISPDGRVGPIGGIQEKIAGAETAGATAFFVPAANCADVAGVATPMRLVKVTTLADAIAALQATPARQTSLPRC